MRVYTDGKTLVFTIFKQACSLASVLLKIKGRRYMIGSYLADNAQLSSTWQNDLINCLEKVREVFF